MKLQYQHFPRSQGITEQIQHVIECFERTYDQIKSPENKLKSNKVLDLLRPHLEGIGFTVKPASGQKIPVPVANSNESFRVDGRSGDGKIVLEVEAGMAWENFAFLQDIVQACMMCDVEFLILAVRNEYRSTNDFDKICNFLERLYGSKRLSLPLTGIVLIGY